MSGNKLWLFDLNTNSIFASVPMTQSVTFANILSVSYGKYKDKPFPLNLV